jgi:hypothetical protein
MPDMIPKDPNQPDKENSNSCPRKHLLDPANLNLKSEYQMAKPGKLDLTNTRKCLDLRQTWNMLDPIAPK